MYDIWWKMIFQQVNVYLILHDSECTDFFYIYVWLLAMSRLDLAEEFLQKH